MGWETFETIIDDMPARIHVDMSAASELEQLDLPNLVKVQAEAEGDHDGLPHARDEERIERLEHELVEWFGAIGGRLVARVEGNCLATWFIYVSCGWLEAANLVHRIGLRQSVALGLHMQPDARNDVYFRQLLPSRAEWAHARNSRLIARLRARGDDTGQPRPVRHVAVFSNHFQALSFARWVRNAGHLVERILPPRQEEAEGYVVQFRQTLPLRAELLDEATLRIEEEAGKLGGEYLGWQAQGSLPCSA